MMKILTTIFIALAISLTSVISAGSDALNPSPESIVTCQTAGPADYKLIAMSLPTSINTEQCIQSDIGLPCAQCIISLENQGCKTLNVVTGKMNEIPHVTYFLSCVKP